MTAPPNRIGGQPNSPRTANQAARGAHPTAKPNTRWLSDVNLLVYEYRSKIASVGNDRWKQSEFSRHAEKMKRADIAIVNAAANGVDKFPLGNARLHVLGLSLS